MTASEHKETVEHSRHAKPSHGFGRSILIEPINDGQEPGTLLDQISEVWTSVSSWGRWCDSDLGEWPEDELVINSLPYWFSQILLKEPDFERAIWFDDLHDRQWIWWNGAIDGDVIKIDLCADAMPISTWMIEFVIEKSGGKLTYSGEWIHRKHSCH